MTGNDDLSPGTRRLHIARLVLFAAFLAGMFYLVAVARVIDVEGVRGVVAATGPVAPLVYVVASAALGAVFVPGPLLAAGSGLLFGPLVGTFVTLGSAVGTAIITSSLGRRAGRESARGLRRDPPPHGNYPPHERAGKLGWVGARCGKITNSSSPSRTHRSRRRCE